MDRLATRLLAIVLAFITIVFFRKQSAGRLLVFSQVVLSLQLSLAVIPLVMFTSDHKLMGEFVNSKWLKVLAWAGASIIVALNARLLLQTFIGWCNP